MKKSEVQKILINCPRYGAIFKLKKVPKWVIGDLKVGDELTYAGNNVFRCKRTGYKYGITPYWLEFKCYRRLK
jgi:hypothetical protein